jgi:hypothetical protein
MIPRLAVRHTLGPALAAVLVVAAGADGVLAQPAAVPAQALAAHRAIYDLSLVEARDRAGVRNISGRLVYEFARRDCRSVLTYRQVMSMLSGEGQGGVLDFRSTTDETDSANSFSFKTTSSMAGQAQPSIDGAAKRGKGDQVQIALKEPQPKATTLAADALFPTQHLRRVLAAAEAGEFTVAADVFDGGEPGDTASPSVTFIGPTLAPPGAGADAVLKNAGLDKLRHWPVSISYFDRAASDSEQTPKFIFGADLFENGIAGALRLDYGNFVVSGKLVGLDVLPAGACTKN